MPDNIRSSMHETILYIEHFCFHIGEEGGKWKNNIYSQKKNLLFFFFSFFIF